MKIAELVQSTKKAGSHLLVMENSYALFGHEKTNDMVIVGSHQVKNAHASLYENGKRVEKSHDELLDLFQHLSSLRRTSAVAMFTIYKDDVKRIKESVKSLDATHLRFHSSEHGVTVTVFDFRDFDYDRRIGRKNSLKVNYLDIETTETDDFTFTLNAESLKKLPSGDWNIRIGQNGVTEITPMGESMSYLIRDQKLVEPVTIFDSVSVGRKISFLFHPN
jgi:Txe/YoeB family toxin of Txe-Axe toxin-antitoxin module